jgi:hypothetical protein
MRSLLLVVPLALSPAQPPQDPQARPSPSSTSVTRVYATIPRLELSAYAGVATEVVYAYVTGTSRRAPGPVIERTVIDLDVRFALKHGAAAAPRSFVIDGIDEPGSKSILVGAPRFAVGDEVVLFLSTDRTTGTTGLLGLGGGVYRVRPDAQGRPAVSGLHAKEAALDAFLGRVVDAWAEFEARPRGR